MYPLGVIKQFPMAICHAIYNEVMRNHACRVDIFAKKTKNIMGHKNIQSPPLGTSIIHSRFNGNVVVFGDIYP